MEFDKYLDQKVGSFGKFQIMLIAALILPDGFVALSNLSSVFISGKPEHHCKVNETL